MGVTPQKRADQKDDALFDDDAELQRVLDEWQRALSEPAADPAAADPAEDTKTQAAIALTAPATPTALRETDRDPEQLQDEPPGTSWRRIAAATAVAKAAAHQAPPPAASATPDIPAQTAEPAQSQSAQSQSAQSQPAETQPANIDPENSDNKNMPPEPAAAPRPTSSDPHSRPQRHAAPKTRKPAAISGAQSGHHHKPATPVTLPRARLEKTAKHAPQNRPENRAANQNTPQSEPQAPIPASSAPAHAAPAGDTPERASTQAKRDSTAPVPANENSITHTPQRPQQQEAPQKTAESAPEARHAPKRTPQRIAAHRKPQRTVPETAVKPAGKSRKREKPADKWRRQYPHAAQTGAPFENPLPPKPSRRRKPPIMSAEAAKLYTDAGESDKKPPVLAAKRTKRRPKTEVGQGTARRSVPRANRTPANDRTPGTTPMTAQPDVQTSSKPTPRSGETPSGKGAKDENFPVGSFLLPAKLRPHVAKYYAFARAVDDIADNPDLAPGDKIARLDAFDAALRGEAGYGDEFAKAHALRDSLRDLGITTDHGSHLLIAFREDAVKTRYANWAELMHYCSNSANPVGRYLLDLHGEDKADYPYSDALCTVLQVLNHMQDCAEDLANLDRCYIPQDWMEQEGTRTEDLTKPELTPGMRAVFDRMLDEVDEMMRTARVLPVVMKNRHLAMESATIVNLAARLAAKLRKRDPLAARVSLSKADFAFSGLAGILKGLFKT